MMPMEMADVPIANKTSTGNSKDPGGVIVSTFKPGFHLPFSSVVPCLTKSKRHDDTDEVLAVSKDARTHVILELKYDLVVLQDLEGAH